jgi:hypothetical protein
LKLLALVLATATLAACSDRSPSTDVPTDDARTAQATPAPPRDTADDAPASPAPATAPTPAPTTPATPADNAALDADYLGRWTGVEGMYLVVAPKPGGGVTLERQWDHDHTGTFDGSVTAEGLRFMRGGVAESAVRTNGDATGLKYLAGQKDCLTVKPGEGYCRD